MGRPKRWIEEDIIDGIGNIYISNWKYFSTFVQDELLDYDDYIYRGQANEKWLLESTITRYARDNKEFQLDLHLFEFQMATRGRRGFFPDYIEEEDDWWGLGQHYGLMTPMLDWTVSPFVAAYFAYAESRPEDEKFRVIYALHYSSIDDKYEEHKKLLKQLKGKEKKTLKERMVKFVEPYLDQNSRLVNQRGLFTKLPINSDLETWIREEFKGESDEYIMMKIHLPNKECKEVLRQLNRMNINPLTLFPELIGASEYCNNKVRIKSY